MHDVGVEGEGGNSSNQIGESLKLCGSGDTGDISRGALFKLVLFLTTSLLIVRKLSMEMVAFVVLEVFVALP